ncbi:MAG: cupin domain-containing protein [Candidatus Marinarcus sp.]|uniref:cupin domain-containing protein n=1 Tax=Candidatus Marinarcus sp. TaxID=3100987 RepID=UPI003B008334
MDKISFYNNILVDKKSENFSEIFKNEVIRIEKIVSNGQKSPENFWYEQHESEFVLVLKGKALLEFENETLELNEGEAVNIPAFTKHRVKYTHLNEPTIWLAIFYQ